MLAAVIHAIGAPPVLEDVPEPVPGPGEALVEVRAAGINPIDISTASGRFYGGHPSVPYIAGSEMVGRVLAGSRFAEGTRVYGTARTHGALAERVVVAEDELYELPDGDDDALAVGLGIAGLTGWLAVRRARVARGDRVLVLAATGSVGSIALQGARIAGAARVVAAGRDPERLERARALGADATVRLEDGDRFAEALREAFGGDGPDVIIDPVWGAPLVAALETAAPNARVVNLGQSAGAEASVPSRLVRGKMLELLGYANARMPLAERASAHATLLEGVRAGRVHLDLRTYPLTQAVEAWQAQVAGPHAKLVVVPA